MARVEIDTFEEKNILNKVHLSVINDNNCQIPLEEKETTTNPT